jgi:hypothetical protein
VLDLFDLRGPVASAVLFAAVLEAEQAILPALGIGAPTPMYGGQAVAVDALRNH